MAYKGRLRQIYGELPVGTHIAGISPNGPGVVHHAVYCGTNEVIHYIQDGGHSSGPSSGCSVQTWSMEQFVDAFPSWHVVTLPNDDSHGADIMAYARQRVGESSYNFITNNCESFARRYMTLGAVQSSLQVQAALVNANDVVQAGVHAFAVDAGVQVGVHAAAGLGMESGMAAALFPAASITFGSLLFGGALWLWGQHRVASRVPVAVVNFTPHAYKVDLSVSGISRFRTKRFRHGSCDGDIKVGQFLELNPATDDETWTLTCTLSNSTTPTAICVPDVTRGDIIVLHGEGTFSRIR